PETDLGYDLSGVEVLWQARTGDGRWNGWLPHLDLAVARQLTQSSAPHQELSRVWKKPGTLTLRTKLHVKDMLRPAVQPGAKIDYDGPPEQVTLVSGPRQNLEIRTLAGIVPTTTDPEGFHCAPVTASPNADVPVALDIRLATGDGEPDLRVTFHTNEDA